MINVPQGLGVYSTETYFQSPPFRTLTGRGLFRPIVFGESPNDKEAIQAFTTLGKYLDLSKLKAPTLEELVQDVRKLLSGDTDVTGFKKAIEEYENKLEKASEILAKKVGES